MYVCLPFLKLEITNPENFCFIYTFCYGFLQKSQIARCTYMYTNCSANMN